MERWLKEMEYCSPFICDEEFFRELKKFSSNPRVLKVWRHIFEHVRPKEQVKIIRKQCLLQRLQSCDMHADNQVPLNCLKDFEEYIRMKKIDMKLKSLKQRVEEKKRVIAEHLCKLEHERKSSIVEEIVLKEKIYKLNNIKKKKRVVQKDLQKLRKDTEIMNILRIAPKKFVDYGSKVKERERKVLVFVNELPSSSEEDMIIKKMEELLKTSQLTPIPSCDHTETLTEMDSLLLHKLKILNERKLELEEKDKELMDQTQSLYDLVTERGPVFKNYVNTLLDDFVITILKDVVTTGKSLSIVKIPHSLESQNLIVRRFKHLILEYCDQLKNYYHQFDGSELLVVQSTGCMTSTDASYKEAKAKDINRLLPIENGDFNSDDMPSAAPEISFPERPLTKILHNYVSKEVKSYMDLVFYKQEPELNIDYYYPCPSSLNELSNLTIDTEIQEKVLSLMEKLHSLDSPRTDIKEIDGESNHSMPEISQEILDELCHKASLLEDTYNRVKEAFNFLCKQPLNASLMGLKIENRDISYWLERYKITKKELEHLRWLIINNNNRP